MTKPEQIKTIELAIQRMSYAERLREEADRIYFVAKKQLEGIYSSAGPRRKRQPNIEVMKAAVAKRNKSIARMQMKIQQQQQS